MSGGGPYAGSASMSGGGPYAGSASMSGGVTNAGTGSIDLERFGGKSGFGSADFYGGGPPADSGSSSGGFFEAGTSAEAAAIAAAKAKEAASAALAQASAAFGFIRSSVSGVAVPGRLGGVLGRSVRPAPLTLRFCCSPCLAPFLSSPLAMLFCPDASLSCDTACTRCPQPVATVQKRSSECSD